MAVLSAEVLLCRSSWDLGWKTPVPLLILRCYAVPDIGMGAAESIGHKQPYAAPALPMQGERTTMLLSSEHQCSSPQKRQERCGNLRDLW